MQGARRQGVALGGFMGVGKSTVGRALAARLGLPFVDLDEELTRRHGPIAEQFARDGEAAFRARERALVEAVSDGRPRVLATGGGTWADEGNRRRLRGCYRLVVLHAPLDELRRRVGSGEGRPVWSEAEARLAERAGAYADAELSVETGGREVEDIVDDIVDWLEEED